MTFLALTLLVEIAAAIALLRMKRTQRGHVMNCAAFLISLASACSIAIAVQGCVMYNASMIERWQLWLGLMWLIAGLFGFAISISMRPIRASITSPCWMVATVAVAYALLYRDMMSAAVGGVIMAFTIGISCRLPIVSKGRKQRTNRLIGTRVYRRNGGLKSELRWSHTVPSRVVLEFGVAQSSAT